MLLFGTKGIHSLLKHNVWYDAWFAMWKTDVTNLRYTCTVSSNHWDQPLGLKWRQDITSIEFNW